MKKLVFISSMVFVTLFFLTYHILGKENKLVSQNQFHINNSVTGSSDTLIRLMNDSVGIGYFHNGTAIIDNLDLLHFTYVDDIERLAFTMNNIKMEGPFGHYYLMMEGNNSNKSIKIAFPCFGDVPNIKNEYPRNFDIYMNTCYGESGSNCNFIKNEDYNIIGVSSICKHAVTRSGGAEYYRKYILDYTKYPAYGSY